MSAHVITVLMLMSDIKIQGDSEVTPHFKILIIHSNLTFFAILLCIP